MSEVASTGDSQAGKLVVSEVESEEENVVAPRRAASKRTRSCPGYLRDFV